MSGGWWWWYWVVAIAEEEVAVDWNFQAHEAGHLQMACHYSCLLLLPYECQVHDAPKTMMKHYLSTDQLSHAVDCELIDGRFAMISYPHHHHPRSLTFAVSFEGKNAAVLLSSASIYPYL
eukprot:scaffold10158_cov187-Skeletonema_marinoi.AAC.2